MNIDKIKYEIKKVYLKQPVKVSFGTIEYMDNIFISCEIDNKLVQSEISNLEYVTKVDLNTVIKDVEIAINYIQGKDINDFEKYIEYLNDVICMPALCGIDNLLYGLYTTYKNISIAEYISSNYKKNKSLNYTIGIQKSKEDTLDKINEYLDDGKTNIKLKTGENVDNDIDTINYIFENNNEIKLRVDVNQGYDLDDYKKFINNVDISRLILIEQVSSYDNVDILKEIRDANKEVYLLADESIRSYNDAKILCSDKQVDAFNIKLIKCGGIFNAIKINKLAFENNIETMIGCMAETQIALSYAANLYLALDNMKNADLDSYDLIKNSEYKTNIRFNSNNLEIII